MITGLGLGTKQAPDNVNLDPQRQFWSWLTATIHPDEKSADSNHHQRAYFSGFACTQTTPAGMSIQIGGSDEADSAAIILSNGLPVLLSTDGTPQTVTIPTAPASGSRIDAVVSYIDTTSPDPESETPGTPEYVRTIVVSGAAASSPSAPTDEQIVAALPAGANGKYYRWCDVAVATNQTVITDSNITDRKPASPNLYWTKPTQTAPYSSVITATSGTFSGQKTLATYLIKRSGTYLVAYQIAVGSIGTATRGMLVELRKNNVVIPGTHMRNYMPGEGVGGAQQTMSCVWAGALTAGQSISVAAMPESGQMSVQTGSLTVLEIPKLTNIN